MCDARCWTPMPCPTCGHPLLPHGRSAPMEMYEAPCCEDARHSDANTRHLWDEHDSTRHYTDPEGWAAHERECPQCNPQGQGGE